MVVPSITYPTISGRTNFLHPPAIDGLRRSPHPPPSYTHVLLPDSAEEAQIMGMPAPQPITTIEDLLALPDDGRSHELLDGIHVVNPVPRPDHERVVFELWLLLRTSIGDRRDLEVFGGKADIYLGIRMAFASLTGPRLRSQSSPWKCFLHRRPRTIAAPSAGSTSGPVWRNIGSWISMPAWWSGGAKATSDQRS